jgi:CubicO group peptidase (beta-lactamase class C family)
MTARIDENRVVWAIVRGRPEVCNAVAHGLLVLLTALASGSSHAGSEVPPPRYADPNRLEKLSRAFPAIEAMMTDRMREKAFPGLVYGIVVDGRLVEVKALGKRDTETGAATAPDTVFRIASMTKSFTAVVILKLRDAGKLGLDDPASRYLPELRGWRLATADSGPVTIRQLLAHTAGLPEDNPWGDRQLAMSDAAFSELLSHGIPYSAANGSVFEYSSLGRRRAAEDRRRQPRSRRNARKAPQLHCEAPGRTRRLQGR